MRIIFGYNKGYQVEGSCTCNTSTGALWGIHPYTDDTCTVDHFILSVIVPRCTAHHWIHKNALQYLTVQKPNLTLIVHLKREKKAIPGIFIRMCPITEIEWQVFTGVDGLESYSHIVLSTWIRPGPTSILLNTEAQSNVPCMWSLAISLAVVKCGQLHFSWCSSTQSNNWEIILHGN